MDAETDEVPVRCFKVSRNRQGKLFLDGIKEDLANRGQVLLGIGTVGQPAHKEGWTVKTYNTTPVQLIVGPKPFTDTMYGSEVCACVCLSRLYACLRYSQKGFQSAVCIPCTSALAAYFCSCQSAPRDRPRAALQLSK